jgi:hypothetical protein
VQIRLQQYPWFQTAALQAQGYNHPQVLWLAQQHTSAAMPSPLQQAYPAELLLVLLLLVVSLLLMVVQAAPCRCCTRWAGISERH